jgi:uncharacterized protein (TIGR03118 family)
MRVSRLGGTKVFAAITLMAVIVGVSSLASAASSYKATVMTADTSGVAPNVDPNLVNAWGISFSATGPFWISDNNTGLSTVYNSTGVVQAIVVTIPPVGGATVGTPTGTVANSTTDFTITQGTKSGPALFLFDSEDGSITGWNPGVNATTAVIAKDNAGAGAIYKGMEIANNGTGNFLYVCNFFNRKVEVYDRNFNPVNLAGSFTDPQLPATFAPHNIRLINGQLYVLWAKQNATKTDPLFGPGLGVVDIFDLNGNFVKHLTIKGKLNAPWGIAIAPSTFGTFANDILVGNLGDGKITAFNPTTGATLGQLTGANGLPVKISGLWGLTFGNGGQGGTKDTLYFTAGPGAYAHGWLGNIVFVP